MQELLPNLNEDITSLQKLSEDSAAVEEKLDELMKKTESLKPDAGAEQFEDVSQHLELAKAEVEKFRHEASLPIRFALRPESFSADEVPAKLDAAERFLKEKRDKANRESAIAALTTKVAEESMILNDCIERAQNVEEDNETDMDQLNGIIDDLNKARENLSALEDVQTKLMNIPDTDVLRAEVLDKMSQYGENLKTIQSSLEDRRENLKSFNDAVSNAEKELGEVSAATDKLEPANADTDLLNIGALLQAAKDLRAKKEELEENVQSLSPMVAPAARLETFLSRCNAVEQKLGVKFCITLLSPVIFQFSAKKYVKQKVSPF